jgi:dTMP kinase
MPFILLEGGEGVGKSTLLAKLEARFQAAGLPVEKYREPGSVPQAEEIREILVKDNNSDAPLNTMEELVLFSMARFWSLRQKLRPLLAQQKWVLSDRYFPSTIAYQSAGGLPRELVETVAMGIVKDTLPDLTLYLDVPPEIGLARSLRPGNTDTRFEKKGLAYHQQIRETYKELATRPNSLLIDATVSPEEVEAAAVAAINTHFNLTL